MDEPVEDRSAHNSPEGPEVAADRRRGRGAATNPAVRYDDLSAEPVDDGWGREEDLPPLRTEITMDRSRTIIASNRSPDVPFNRSINPYRGCEHGCVYCFARPTHAHLGLSPGLDFETRLTVKPDAPALLEAAFAKSGYRPEVLAIGTNTDPYQPIEREHRVMRGLLMVLAAHRHPVSITTKGALILRDIDLLGPMGRDGLAQVAISLTSLDHRLSRSLEPRAAAPKRRLAAISALARAGVPVTVNVSPIIPSINDTELERLLEAAADAGARHASSIVLRLPLEVSPLFRDWLGRTMPDRAARVMRKVREMNGGRDYDPTWGRRMRGRGVEADLISRRFRIAARRMGLDRPLPPLRTDLFHRPAGGDGQLALEV